jgi:hypothetical protein
VGFATGVPNRANATKLKKAAHRTARPGESTRVKATVAIELAESCHTLKSQVVVNGRTRQIICTAHGRGPTHDFDLYKESKLGLHESLEMLADSGYQGLDKLHEKSRTPKRDRRKAAGRRMRSEPIGNCRGGA